jgi:hypothetical protein
LLFPDGRIPSRRWRWLLVVYALAAAVWLFGQLAANWSAFSGPITIDPTGQFLQGDNAGGIAFGFRLRNATDFGSIRGELLQVVNDTIAPAHASLWIRPGRVDSAHGSGQGT